MTTSIREYVQANVETAIAGITTSNGYINTIRHHERARVAPYDGPYPAVFIHDGGDSLEQEYDTPAQYLMTLGLECWLKGTTAAASGLATSVNVLIADVQKAVMADYTRGGYAIETKVRGVSPVHVTDDNLAGCVITLEIQYRTKRGDPYTQQ